MTWERVAILSPQPHPVTVLHVLDQGMSLIVFAFYSLCKLADRVDGFYWKKLVDGYEVYERKTHISRPLKLWLLSVLF